MWGSNLFVRFEYLHNATSVANISRKIASKKKHCDLIKTYDDETNQEKKFSSPYEEETKINFKFENSDQIFRTECRKYCRIPLMSLFKTSSEVWFFPIVQPR